MVAIYTHSDLFPETMEAINLKEGLRKRSKLPPKRWEPPKGTWDSSLPYGGKVFVARKKKADSWLVIFLEVAFSVSPILVKLIEFSN